MIGERWLYRALAGDWDGDECVPIDHKTLRFTSEQTGCEEIASVTNDAFDLALGWPDRWHVIYRREDFHRIIRWYLKQWAFGEWFGLRRFLWYKLLNRRVESFAGISKSRNPNGPAWANPKDAV